MTMHATGQDGDIIYMNGEQWELLGKPVYADSVLSRELREALPEGRCQSTANWSGYTACWSIRQEKLCLDSILYERYEARNKIKKECLPLETVLRIFRKYVDGNHIVFTCFNGDLRMAKGEQIYYEHAGFRRNYECERLVSIAHGKVCGMKDYQNYVVEGFSFDNYSPKSPEEVRKMFPLHLEQYPELADAKRILFRVKRARIDAQGHLVECEVKVLKPSDNQRLAAEMAQAMKAYHPWRVLYINGECRAYGIEGYTFPYIIDE